MKKINKNKVIGWLVAMVLIITSLSSLAIGRIDIYGSISEYKCTGTPEANITFYDTAGNDSLFCFYSDSHGTKVICLNGTTGNVTIYNNLTAIKNITADYFIGNGSLLTGVKGGNPFNQDLNTTDSPTFAGLTLTGFNGFLKAVAGVVGTSAINVADIGDIATNYLKLDGSNANQDVDIGTYNFTTTGNVSATYFFGNGSFLTGINVSNITGLTLCNLSDVDTTGVVANDFLKYNGAGWNDFDLFASNNIWTGINIFNDVNISGNLNVTGYVNATYFIGDGGNLTNITGAGNPFDQWLNTTDNASFTYLDIVNDVNISNDLTIDGDVLCNADFTISAGGVRPQVVFWDTDMFAGSTYLQSQAFAGLAATVTLPRYTCTLGGLGLPNAWTNANSYFAQYIKHYGDTNTYMQFTPDEINFYTGGSQLLRMWHSLVDSGYFTTFNENSADMDFRIESDDDSYMFFIDGNTSKLALSDSSPAALLDVGGGSINHIDGTDDLLVKDDAEIDGTLFVDGGLNVYDNANITGAVIAFNFHGDGGNLTNINASNLTGDLSLENISVNNITEYNNYGIHFLDDINATQDVYVDGNISLPLYSNITFIRGVAEGITSRISAYSPMYLDYNAGTSHRFRIQNNIVGRMDVNGWYVGGGVPGKDYVIQVDGEDSDGQIVWKEDENYWQFTRNVMMYRQGSNPTMKLFFGETIVNLTSPVAGALDINANYVNVSGDVNVSGASIAFAFHGDGGNLTNISTASEYWNRSGATIYPYYDGDDLQVNGSITADGFHGDGGNLTNINASNLTGDLSLENISVNNITEYNNYGIHFLDDVLFGTTTQLQFRDNAIHIESTDDGHLDLTADVSIDINLPSTDIQILERGYLGGFLKLPILRLENNLDSHGGAIDNFLYIIGTDNGAGEIWFNNADITQGVMLGLDLGNDRLRFPDDIIIESNEKLFFRDNDININSADDGHLDLTADTSIDLNSDVYITGYLNVTKDINSTANINCSGKITAGGGVDPPYVLYNRENLFDILARINREIPQDQFKKWGGQVLFYDADIDNMCILNPASGDVREFVWKDDFDALEDRVDILEIQMQQLINNMDRK